MPVSEFAVVPLGYSRLADMVVSRQWVQGADAFWMAKSTMPPLVVEGGTVKGP